MSDYMMITRDFRINVPPDKLKIIQRKKSRKKNFEHLQSITANSRPGFLAEWLLER